MENKVIKAGTKIAISMNAGFAGSDQTDAFILVQDYTEEELGDVAWHMGVEHASMYGVYPECDRPEDEAEDSEEIGGDEYSDNIEGYWELYDEKEHEGKCSYGNGGPTFKKI